MSNLDPCAPFCAEPRRFTWAATGLPGNPFRTWPELRVPHRSWSRWVASRRWQLSFGDSSVEDGVGTRRELRRAWGYQRRINAP